MNSSHDRLTQSQEYGARSAVKSTIVEAHTPLQFVPSVGPNRAALFQKLGLQRALDLLFFFPRNYQDIDACQSVMDFESGTRATVAGQIVDIDQRLSFEGRSTVGVLLAIEGGGYVRCVWFNQPFRRQMYSHGMRVVATGVVKSTGTSFEFRHPEVTVLEEGQPIPDAKPLPIYPLTEGLQQRHVASAVQIALDALIPQIEESLPPSIRRSQPTQSHEKEMEVTDWKHAPLLGIQEALLAIHLPNSIDEANRARYRFIFQELFIYQLALAMRRYHMQHDRPAPCITASPQIHARILKRFPFELTSDQRSAIEDLRIDMAKSIPMNRLIQGDVGSGKTVIAQYAMLNAVANKYQAALMAPTELLARQHFLKLTDQLRGSQVMVELFVGSLSQRERNELLQRIAIGTVDIVVGTQALIGEQVQFSSLGLVVIDEQHKFGVEQRANLRQSRIVPHYLVLSATPIPRTIAMTVFGDLDVSILRAKPLGRASVHTYLGNTALQNKWWEFVIKQLKQGRQAYVVTPRVESENETIGADRLYAELRSGIFSQFRIDILHGRMTGDEKQSKLEAFQSGQTQVLVTTTLVEVGIDVPNATVMTILDADRLGLAQLHQLRGRVSRGTYPGYVCLFTRPGVIPEENSRLSAFAATDDGFALAEQDLQLRGPGDLLGTKQVGLPQFRIADLVRDASVIAVARSAAIELIQSDPLLEQPEHARLKRLVQQRHGNVIQLGDVG